MTTGGGIRSTAASERDRDPGRDNAPRGDAEGRGQAHERRAVYARGGPDDARTLRASDTVAALSAVDSDLGRDVFAGYRIEGVAGRGGMGVVYRAIAARPRAAGRAEGDRAARSREDEAFRERFVAESRVGRGDRPPAT